MMLLPKTLPVRPSIRQMQTALPLRCVGTRSTTAPLRTDMHRPGSTKYKQKQIIMAISSMIQINDTAQPAAIRRPPTIEALRPIRLITKPITINPTMSAEP